MIIEIKLNVDIAVSKSFGGAYSYRLRVFLFSRLRLR